MPPPIAVRSRLRLVLLDVLATGLLLLAVPWLWAGGVGVATIGPALGVRTTSFAIVLTQLVVGVVLLIAGLRVRRAARA